MIFPNKLKPGDEIRVIAPSRSQAVISKEHIKIALDRFNKMDIKVTFCMKAS